MLVLSALSFKEQVIAQLELTLGLTARKPRQRSLKKMMKLALFGAIKLAFRK